MQRSKAGILIVILAITAVYATVYTTVYAPVHSQTNSCTTTSSFQTTFETLHTAELSGANIHDLIAEYNVLLNQPANVSAGGFQQICMQAARLQAISITDRNTRNLIIAILLPSLSLVLAIATALTLSVASRIRKNRLSDMRILRN
jgi:hypothetical protein